MGIGDIKAVVSEMNRLAELVTYLYGKGVQGSNNDLIAVTKESYKSLAKLIEGVTHK